MALLSLLGVLRYAALGLFRFGVGVSVAGTLAEAGTFVDDRRVDLVLTPVATPDRGAGFASPTPSEVAGLLDDRVDFDLVPVAGADGGIGGFSAGDTVPRLSSLHSLAWANAAAFFAALESSMLVMVGMVGRREADVVVVKDRQKMICDFL